MRWSEGRGAVSEALAQVTCQVGASVWLGGTPGENRGGRTVGVGWGTAVAAGVLLWCMNVALRIRRPQEDWGEKSSFHRRAEGYST